jgi:hypothetical protein
MSSNYTGVLAGDSILELWSRLNTGFELSANGRQAFAPRISGQWRQTVLHIANRRFDRREES